MRFLKVFWLIVGVLLASTSTGHTSEEIKSLYCPSAEEWTSTLDDEKREMFWTLARTILEMVVVEQVFDESREESLFDDEDFQRVSWLLGLHSIRTVEPNEDLKDLTLTFQREPGVTDYWHAPVLEEISQCILSDDDVDCAKMVYEKKYIPSIEFTAKEKYVYKYFDKYLIFCELFPYSTLRQ